MAPRVAFVSFRLGLLDGVSVAAAAWARSFLALGFGVVTVAGEGPVDRLVAGLALGAVEPPTTDELSAALDDIDLVVVPNALTIPMHLAASCRLATVLAGRPALLHHHDFAWERARFNDVAGAELLPPDDPAWRHAVLTRNAADELKRRRGTTAAVVPNGFDVHEPGGDRTATRAALGIDPARPLLLHPVRAIARKEVGRALELAGAVGATYWLTGPPEEGYGRELDRLLATAPCPVVHRPVPGPMADGYAACDAVLYPSSWEGFGNPPVEAAVHGRMAVVGHYPAADELRALGLRWLEPDDADGLARWLASPDTATTAANAAVVGRHLSLDALTRRLDALVAGAGWSP